MTASLATITALSGCGLLGIASGYSPEKAAVGYWSCEPVGTNNLGDGVVVVDVRHNHTFKISHTGSDGDTVTGSGTWRVFDGNLVVTVRQSTSANVFRVFGFAKLGPRSTSFSVGLNGKPARFSPHIKVSSTSRFEIDSAEEDSEPWRCEKS